MKISKCILLTILSLSLFTCGSDDDSTEETPELTIITPSTSIADVDAILALPANSDITDLVSFGQASGISTADHETILELNDIFRLERPEGLLPGDIFYYGGLYFSDLDGEEIGEGFVSNFLERNIPSGEPLDYYDFPVPNYIYDVIGNSLNDLEWKYDIECFIIRDGTEYGPYWIDPKVRLKGSSNTN